MSSLEEFLRNLQPRERHPSIAGLAEAQWKFLQWSPFHNIDLLAGVSPMLEQQAAEASLSGRGGPCHVQAAGYLRVLEHLGYSAHFCEATVNQPGDHLVILVEVGGCRFISDAGNGHPYRQPFPIDGVRDQFCFGWHFKSTGSHEGLHLEREIEPGCFKVVYDVDLTPRRYTDFARIIERHHSEHGFGPFMGALRAVRIFDDAMISLRDDVYSRHGPAGTWSRRVPNQEECRKLLHDVFGLAEASIERALDALSASLGRFELAERRKCLISVACTDRPSSLEKLVDSM